MEGHCCSKLVYSRQASSVWTLTLIKKKKKTRRRNNVTNSNKQYAREGTTIVTLIWLQAVGHSSMVDHQKVIRVNPICVQIFRVSPSRHRLKTFIW